MIEHRVDRGSPLWGMSDADMRAAGARTEQQPRVHLLSATALLKGSCGMRPPVPWSLNPSKL